MRLFALIAAVPLAACSLHADKTDSGPGVAGSGSGSSRSFAVTGFDSIELRGSDDVDVRVGPAFSVRAEGPSKQLDQLRIDKDGDTLRVGRIDGVHIDWGGDRGSVKVHVTMPAITAASIAGSGDMTIDKAAGGVFKGSSAGSGTLSIAAMAAGDASFSIAGSGDIEARGSAKSLAVDIAGSGDFDAAGLTAASAKVSVAGSGGVRATVNGPAQVSLMGSGDVDLGDGAVCTTSKMGSGEVRCGK